LARAQAPCAILSASDLCCSVAVCVCRVSAMRCVLRLCTCGRVPHRNQGHERHGLGGLQVVVQHGARPLPPPRTTSPTASLGTLPRTTLDGHARTTTVTAPAGATRRAGGAVGRLRSVAMVTKRPSTNAPCTSMLPSGTHLGSLAAVAPTHRHTHGISVCVCVCVCERAVGRAGQGLRVRTLGV
jgi:hypothetical protein